MAEMRDVLFEEFDIVLSTTKSYHMLCSSGDLIISMSQPSSKRVHILNRSQNQSPPLVVIKRGSHCDRSVLIKWLSAGREKLSLALLADLTAGY